MNNSIKTGLLCASLMASSAAMAGDYYGGINYSSGSLDDKVADPYKIKVWELKAGTYVTDNIAIEGRYRLSSTAEDVANADGSTGKVDAGSLMSVFVKADYNVTDSFSTYGLLGYSSIDVEATVSSGNVSATVSDKDSGLSYGAGISYDATDNLALTLEYVQYIDGKFETDTSSADYTYTSMNLGINYSF